MPADTLGPLGLSPRTRASRIEGVGPEPVLPLLSPLPLKKKKSKPQVVMSHRTPLPSTPVNN